MTKNLMEKLLESAKSALPISAIILLLHFTIAPMPTGTLMLLLTGTLLLIIGMAIFSLGADLAMMPMGEAIGAKLTQSRNLVFLVLGCFLLGVFVTLAEPDLQVLTKQVPAVPDMVLVLAVACGVGIFLVFALLRILFQIKLSYMFIFMYALVFIVAAFTGSDFIAVGFDSGGVTTGPITVPFILALGVGVSSVRGGKSAEEDSFGLCALCSIGPILAVLILGMFFDSSQSGYAFETVSNVSSAKELFSLYTNGFVMFAKEVFIAMLPIIVIFFVLQPFSLKLPKSQLIKIVIGLIYTFIGLTIFLTGVNIGFMPAGTYLGEAIGGLSYQWILIPLSIMIGFFVVAAEPAVHVLNKQVEDITSGTISRKMMMSGLSIGVSIALVLAMIRIMTGISIWYFLLPGYGISLILTFFVPPIFTAIAFDSGGVASGTMAAAFLLPFAMGVCTAFGGNPMEDAFGIIAMVAMMPLVSIQIMGMIYAMKLKKSELAENIEENIEEDVDVIEM